MTTKRKGLTKTASMEHAEIENSSARRKTTLNQERQACLLIHMVTEVMMTRKTKYSVDQHILEEVFNKLLTKIRPLIRVRELSSTNLMTIWSSLVGMDPSTATKKSLRCSLSRMNMKNNWASSSANEASPISSTTSLAPKTRLQTQLGRKS